MISIKANSERTYWFTFNNNVSINIILDTELAIIPKLPLFANLPPDVLGEVLHGAFQKNYGKIEILFSRNDPSDLFYVVLDEWVKVYRETPDGEEAVFGFYTE